ncbi:DUF3320 domain-containing protein [uncultured Methanobrevibacter sp.]|uniref:DUF3320 domain-containing protein n=1 Tax=uncultured Methanobrevibacter sp. TaxID=253161 RepID=UPI002624D646|nr:DUF3320 domain-containing protein [uncultured Methanobrevibacter sp.]
MLNNSSDKIKKEFENLRNELLDLTLRNQLLNFKSRARTITIANQSPINIYQTLVLQNNKMYFVANKKEEKKEKSGFSIWDHAPFDLSRFSDGDKTLATDLTPNELQKRLFYINNQAKTMLQEQGYNILYLAVGFLEWRDNTKPKQVNHAPLVLIPVSMERKKVGKSFNLAWTGEDIQTNISIKAKLKENGVNFPDFKFKKYGEAIDHYLREVRDSVRGMGNWKVNTNVALGFFSFTKFVMYNDLNPEAWENNVDLTKNELIQAIFDPSINDKEAFKEEDIDSQLEYSKMYQVLDADSSQIAAIQDVKAGRNLVVEGPPGTGKSQTIVNLIAELLAEGKSVLFVSEKMAALDVVKDRLTSVGLGKFILEIHSHKTRRKKFLKDLEKATTIRSQEPINIDQTIRKLETLRQQLDDYAEIIHKPLYKVQLSAFQLYGLKEAADEHFSRSDRIIPLVRFSHPETLTIKDLDDITISLENLAELYQTISKENPWSKCSPKSLLPADLREIEQLINDTLHALDDFLVERGRVYDIYGIKKPDTLNEFDKSLSAFEIISSKNSELIDGDILKSGAWNNNTDEVYKLIKELENYQKISKSLDKFNSNIFSADIDRLIRQVQESAHKKLSRLFGSKQHIDVVERYYQNAVPKSPEDVIFDLEQAKQVINIKNKLDANEHLARKYYGDYWHLGADVNDLKEIGKWMNEFTALTREGIFSQNTIDILSKDIFSINPKEDLTEYIESGDLFENELKKLESKLNPRSKLIFKRDTGDVPFEKWQEQLYNWRGQLSSLHLWSQYLNTKNTCKGTDSEQFIDSIERRDVKKEDVKSLVQGNFADSLLNCLFVENQELATFIGELHENRIKEFEDLDKKILALNRKRIFQKLNSNIPQIFGATENPEAKILAGEFTRKSGHLPVRKLLEKAGGIIKKIKPCFMMSPLSVAQYLDPTNEELQFDVVIFDEASQVKPEDALGAFMRGKTAVVMGDTQQLPPTSFFDQMATGESDEEVATSLDMESILHLCKLSFPVKMLKWHYRSRHESLISVSNKEFYNNELLVYPSPAHDDPELGLKFYYNPNTSYDRGSSSANRGEARDVVKEIFNHFDKYGDTKSLGVGTFSVAQKNAILEELEIERKNRPELEPLFAENKDERFFVKNLETIQGDERDVILISVGYGYDQAGKMSLNFGPLNQDGGERRLNVLITRAREKCVVFSNFKAYDMHLTANPPYGVKALKEFLAYAENLTLGTLQITQHSSEPFEDAIASFLAENGYQVDKQIGCAGFRVDLAIVDDENPGKYILGITTDGKMYASSKVARDRDRLREQVLEGLGWKLYHLWSTDWYRNRDLGRKRLLEAVENSIKETREEEKRKSQEAKELAEKRKKEAEKLAEELHLAKQKELEEQSKEDENNSDENIVSLEGVYDVELEENQENSSEFDNDLISSVENDEKTSLEIMDDSDLGDVKVDDTSNLDDNESEVDETFNNDLEFKESTNSDSHENKQIINHKNFNNDEVNDFDEIESKKKSRLSNGFSISSIFKSKNKPDNEEHGDNVSNIKFDNSIKNEVKLKEDSDKLVSKKEDESIESEINDGLQKQNVEKDYNDNSVLDDGEDDLNFHNNIKEELENEDDSKEYIEESSTKNGSKNKSTIKNIFFDNKQREPKHHGALASAIIGKSKLESSNKDEIEIVGGEIMENESPKLHRPTPKDEYVVEPEIVGVDLEDEGNDDKENIFEKVTFKSNINLDDEDIHNVASNIVNNAFEELIDNVNNEKNMELTVIDDDYYHDYDEENQNNLSDDNNSDELSTTHTSDNKNEYYQGVSGITNPLKKNNIYHKTSDYKNKSVKDSLVDLKNEVKYINKSLKEIENPTPAEYVSVIDRTEEYNPDDYITPEHNDDEYEFSQDENDELTFAEAEEKRYEQEMLMEALKKEIASDENVIIPLHEEERRQNIQDQVLENIIQTANNDYTEIEKERFENNNRLKEFDNQKLPGKTNLKDEIVKYKQAEDIGLSSQEELFNKSDDEIAKSIDKIVAIEGPVHINEVIKRVKDSCNIKRAGVNLKKTVNKAIATAENDGDIIKIGDFLYNAANNDIIIRKRVKPNIDLISDDEIAKNIELVLLHKKSISTKALPKEVSRNFGFKSTSKKTANKINSVLDLMIVNNKVKLDKDILELN